MHLMAQPKIATALLDDDNLRDQGFPARFLVSAPDLREQARAYGPSPRSGPSPALQKYDKTSRDMLQMPVGLTESGEVNRRALYLSREAFGLHKRHYNEIQSELVRYGSLMPIKGLAEKAPEHACRLAATLAFASDPKVREIGAEHYNAAELMLTVSAPQAARQIPRPGAQA